MHREHEGFTLIELMFVVAVVGVLAAFAVPTYQNYLIRAQVSEGLTLSVGAKAAVSGYFMDRGTWPSDNAAAGLADQHDILGTYTEHVAVEDNVIEIKYGYDANSAIFNEKITLTAAGNAGRIRWTCTSAIRAQHLPSSCR